MSVSTNRLMEMYKSTFQPALEEGVIEVIMTSHEPVTKEGQSPYIKFEFETVESGRKLTENRFEAGLGVMVSHLRQQLNRQNEAIVPVDFFNELVENKTKFKIWITKKVINGRQRTNFNFLEPLKTEETKPVVQEITVVDDSIEAITTETTEVKA